VSKLQWRALSNVPFDVGFGPTTNIQQPWFGCCHPNVGGVCAQLNALGWDYSGCCPTTAGGYLTVFLRYPQVIDSYFQVTVNGGVGLGPC
jgi:hypothetical protein